MIKDRKDLRIYLEEDRVALGFSQKHPNLLGHEIWKFQIALRKYEYWHNKTRYENKMLIFPMLFSKLRYHRLSIKLGFTIPPNTFGPGLAIHHYGCIVVNDNARIGKNCIIQQCVNIGQNHGPDDVPTIGDNVYIGPGVKVFGRIKVADGCALGAGAVVNKDINEKDSVVVGNPMRIVGKRREGLK